MLKHIDNFLNRITMYRLTIWGLGFLLAAAFLLSLFGLLSFAPIPLLFSIALLLVVCLLVNQIFAAIYKAPSNVESVYITALILALIISPPKTTGQLMFLAWAAVFAIASKYILAINKKHVFNPAAIAMVIWAFGFSQYASWWTGTLFMAPFVFVVGFLITRKIKRTSLVVSFFATAIVFTLGYVMLKGQNNFLVVKEAILYSPMMFFAFIMLTEPATTPPTKKLQIIYGALAGFFFVPFFHIGNFYISPELDLVLCNLFSYLVSPKEKLILQLKEKIKIATDTYEFVFHPDRKLAFKPGQYMEWTLAHQKQDTRGMRRYFTVASSPTEPDIKVGVKFYQKPSSYKMAMESLRLQDIVVTSQLAGDFTLPSDASKKLIFIAGGIGVTPFRSMVKYLTDKKEKRDIIMFYANNTYADIAYREIFDRARQELGINVIYTLSNLENIPPDFNCENGFVSQEMIERLVPDFKDRMFYISGPRSMIVSFEKTLKDMGIHARNIKTDYFPGFA